MHLYFLLNTNESDDPDSAENAILQIHDGHADYRSARADGSLLVHQGHLDRSTAALYLSRARERGWTIKRYTDAVA